MTDDRIEFATQLGTTVTTPTINEFKKFRDEGSLVMRPAFQRNLVWNDWQKSFLIDSILRGLPVPEVYTQFTTSADGDERHVVVDGQQRIAACLGFLEEGFRLVDKDDIDDRWRGKVFAELPDGLRQRFRSYSLVERRLPELDERVLREIFVRLNKAVESLEPQELRHAAYTGPFIKFVEAAAGAPLLQDTGVFTAADYLRRRNDELIAEIAFAIYSDAFPNKKDGLDQLFLTLEKQAIPDESMAQLRRRFGRVLRQLELSSAAIRRSRFRNKSDFYSLFTLLARRAERLPLSSHAAFDDRLKAFTRIVSEIKQAESQDPPAAVPDDPTTRQGQIYLRGVERAASDRLNRVRRDEALALVLEPLLLEAPVVPLGPEDEAQFDALTAIPDEDTREDPGDVEERAQVQQVLLTADFPT